MDSMDLDQVEEVPDTPERFIASCNNDGKSAGSLSNGSSSCRVISKGSFDEKLRNGQREKGKSVAFHGNRRLFVRPDNYSNSFGLMNGKSSSSKNHLTLDNANHEKGKTKSNSNVQRFVSQESNSFVDLTAHLTAQNGRDHVFGKTATRASGTGTGHPSRKCMLSTNGFPTVDALANSSNSSGLNNAVKFGPRSDCGKGVAVGLQHKPESNSSSPSSLSPKVTRQRRLVRNGCISPHNIAKSKQLADNHDTERHTEVLPPYNGAIVLDSPSSTVDIKDLITEAKNSRRFKGKEVSCHPSFSKEPDARSRHLPERSSVFFKETTDASKDLSVDTSTCVKDSNGWITTRNPTRKIDLPLDNSHISRGKAGSSSAIDRHVQRDNRNVSVSNNIYNHFEDLEIDSTQRVCAPPETMSSRAHKLGQFKERSQLTKRQREGVALNTTEERAMLQFDDPETLIPRVFEEPSTSRSNRNKNRRGAGTTEECAILQFDDPEILIPRVFEEPSTSRSNRNKNRQGAGTSDSVIAVDEFSPEHGNHSPNTHHSSNVDSNVDSSVRALQVEADEMLARELQEQFYNEELASAYVNDEMDAHHALSRAMHQVHGSHAIHAGGRSAYRSASGGSSASNLYQHSRSNSSRNSSVRRGANAQPPTSTRLARLRGRFPGRPRTLSSTSTPRNSIFPPNMDVDMRMQILEALEAFNDMDWPNDMLEIGREFNENDYEMLLALDENNHQHGGATHAQINNLPQSTVQAENLQECAVCLETPTVGETIRHLPCLHSFHKDCIDQWLRRKTSCPVCKSSIT